MSRQRTTETPHPSEDKKVEKMRHGYEIRYRGTYSAYIKDGKEYRFVMPIQLLNELFSRINKTKEPIRKWTYASKWMLAQNIRRI